jgi:hypothetical protein
MSRIADRTGSRLALGTMPSSLAPMKLPTIYPTTIAIAKRPLRNSTAKD